MFHVGQFLSHPSGGVLWGGGGGGGGVGSCGGGGGGGGGGWCVGVFFGWTPAGHARPVGRAHGLAGRDSGIEAVDVRLAPARRVLPIGGTAVGSRAYRACRVLRRGVRGTRATTCLPLTGGAEPLRGPFHSVRRGRDLRPATDRGRYPQQMPTTWRWLGFPALETDCPELALPDLQRAGSVDHAGKINPSIARDAVSAWHR